MTESVPRSRDMLGSTLQFRGVEGSYGELANEYSASCVPPTLWSHVAHTSDPDIMICGWSFCTSVVAPAWFKLRSTGEPKVVPPSVLSITIGWTPLPPSPGFGSK